MCLWIAAKMGSAGGLLRLVLCLLWLEEAVSLPLERTSASGARARYGFRSRKDWWARFHRKALASILNEAVEESPGAALASLKAIDDLHDIHTGFLKSSSRQAVLQDSGLQNSSSSPLPSSSSASHPSSIGHMSDSSSAVAQRQYLYIQAAFPLQSGQTAVLQSGELSGEVCLSFWYSIFGAGVGSLAVYVQSLTFPSGQHRVWSDSGSESRLWYLEKLDISGVGMETYRILFVGTIGNSYCGDAALDDVQVQKGVCLPQHRPLHFRRGERSVPSPTLGTTASSNTTSLFCSFEGSLCGWTQCQRDSFDWRLHAPLAPRQENCIQEREQYLYIMAAFPREHGQTAVLMSPVLQESVCLSFWYSILGQGMGSLTVYMLYADTPDDWHKLWVGRGSGRRTWAWAEVELYTEPGKTFQLLLEGMIQEGSCGDAAVDDIRVERRRCSRK